MTRARGFTLIELLSVLLIFSILALLSYRGLDSVLQSRENLTQQAAKWRSIASFFSRFERDVQLAMPRAVRATGGTAPALAGYATMSGAQRLEFSRFAAIDGVDTARRIAYRLNEQQQIELWLWPGLDLAPNAVPQRYPLLDGVAGVELRYLNSALAWVDKWPAASDIELPRAVQVKLVLATGEQIVRIFEVQPS